MCNEEKKNKLYEYKNICKRIICLQEQLESIRSSAESAKIQKISDMPKGSMSSDLSDLMVDIEQIEERIDDEIIKALKKKVHIESCILEMENADEARLLRLRYIDLKKWEDICVALHYEWRQTHYMHARALKHISV